MPPAHGSEGRPIALLDDEDAGVPQQYAEVRDLRQRVVEQAQGGRSVVYIDEDAAVDEDEYEQQLLQEDEAVEENDVQFQRHARRRRGFVRDPIRGTHRPVSTVIVNGINLKANKFVEIFEALDLSSLVGAQFIEIKSIWVRRNNDHDIIVRGIPYTRNRNVFGRLEAKKNEVCQVLEVEDDDDRPEKEQAAVEIRPEQIMKVRILVTTNKLFSMESKPRFDPVYDTWQKIEDDAPLTCRWKMRVEYRDSAKRKAGKASGGALIKIAEDEVEKRRHRVSDKKLREAWRGPSGRVSRRSSGRYTFSDMFCGAGGVSRGADLAGLEVKTAVDHWPLACQSYRRNFPNTRLYEQEITDFINNREIDYRSHPVDILHLSPPCQFFSPLAYQWSGRNDERNMAALFSCTELIKKLRPRVFTLEQTFGLMHPAHSAFFNALIQGFTCYGYSVQWKVVSFPAYELPSRRDRLMIIGAGPGEPSPPWPQPRRAAFPTRGQKPLVTEIQAIGRLRPGTDLHDVANARAVNKPPRDGNTPLGETICCSGPQKHQHFSGTRAYTLRELACLQGFPVVHRFDGNLTGIRKQIGNAFAPCVAKVFFEHIREHLERVDGVQPARRDRLGRSSALSTSSACRRGRRDMSRGDPEMQQRNVRSRFYSYNGDLDEDKALELALQQSKENDVNGAGRHDAGPGTRRKVQQVFVDLRDSSNDDDQLQDSPVDWRVAPLMGRVSISSPYTSPRAGPSRAVTPASRPAALPLVARPRSATLGTASRSRSRSRSRSATLDFSPGPSRKRSLHDMHDGAEDQTATKESPGKRERLVRPVDDVVLDDDNDDEDDVYVIVNVTPSRRPCHRHNGSQKPSSAGSDGYVVLGRPLGLTAAAPKREGDQDATSEELMMIDEASFKEAVMEKQKVPASSGDNGGWSF